MRLPIPAITIATAILLWNPAASAQSIELYVPDNSPPNNTSNVIPFGATSTFSSGYTFAERIPASFMSLTHRIVREISFIPAGTGSWSCGTVLMGLGHIAAPQPCPFIYPGPGGLPFNSFLDLTIIYDSSIQGPFNWNVTQDVWSPMGFAGMGGTGFVWNGVDDVGFFITFQNASVTGFTGGFRQAVNGPNTRNYAAGYQAASASGTACNEFSALYMRLTVEPASGLFADFSAMPTSGAAPLSVSFVDQSFTSAPGGIQTWAWDVNNDGIDDYFTANPNHVYTCPGPYSVRLSVTDGVNPPSAMTKTGFINVANGIFMASSAGGGVGNLVITPISTSCYPSAAEGYTLVSFSTSMGAAGSGPFLGIYPDLVTIFFINTPASPGNVIHFLVNGVGYPDSGTFTFPAGIFSPLNGLTADIVEVLLDSNRQLVLFSNVARVTF